MNGLLKDCLFRRQLHRPARHVANLGDHAAQTLAHVIKLF